MSTSGICIEIHLIGIEMQINKPIILLLRSSTYEWKSNSGRCQSIKRAEWDYQGIDVVIRRNVAEGPFEGKTLVVRIRRGEMEFPLNT